MSVLSSVAGAIDNRLNPIVVKELRQAVQSRFVTVMILLLLLAQVAIIGGWMLLDQEVATSMSAGRDMFITLLSGLVILSSLLVPLYTGVRLAFERSDTNMDLLYGTTISPRAIVTGKFFCAAVLTAIIYGACMPFIVLTYLLRGIDVPTILLLLAFSYLTLLAATAATILLATPRIGLVWRIGLGLLALAAVGSSIVTSLQGAYTVSFHGPWAMAGTWQFWAVALTVLAAVAAGVMLCLLGAVAIISPPSSNRTFQLRVGATIIWAALGAIAAGWAFSEAEAAPMLVWLGFSVGFFGAAMLVAIDERNHMTMRVARTIPRNRLLRFVAFFFYSGWGGGIAWAVLMLLLCFAATWLVRAYLPSHFREETVILKVLAGIALYVYSYAMTSSLLARTLLKRLVPTSRTWVCVILLAALLTAVPMLMAFLVGRQGWWNITDNEMILLGNPGILAFDKTRNTGLMASTAWAIAATAFSAPLLAEYISRFKPIAAAPPKAAPKPLQTDASQVP